MKFVYFKENARRETVAEYILETSQQVPRFWSNLRRNYNITEQKIGRSLTLFTVRKSIFAWLFH